MWRYILFLYRNSSNHWANRWFCREIWRETIFLRSIRDSFGKPFSATSSTEISRIRAFRQPILIAFRVGVIITSVVYMEREERGKRSIEEERVKMRFVIARHVDRGNALFFFFLKKKRKQFVVFIFWKNWRGRFLRWTKVFLVKSRFLNSSQLEIWWYQS